MNTAIAALDKIYSEVLVNECSGDVLKGFQENLARMKHEWSRKSRVEEFTNLLRKGELEEWRRLHKEAHDKYTHGYTTGEYCSVPLNHDLTLLQEAWVKFDEETKVAIRKAAGEAEFMRLQKEREDELLMEARRRLAAAKREQAIQALMDSLKEEEA